MMYYTTAPHDYDLPDTTEVEPRIATTGTQRIRLVNVEKSQVGDQRREYESHFHVMLNNEGFVDAIDYGMVEEFLIPANYVYTYTDAPEAYDWQMYTIEVHPQMARTRRKGEAVRLVLITKEGEPMQVGRYGSGLFMGLTQQHFEEQLRNEKHGLVIR